MFSKSLVTGAMAVWLSGCTQTTILPEPATASRDAAAPTSMSAGTSGRTYITGYTHRMPVEPRNWRLPASEGTQGGKS